MSSIRYYFLTLCVASSLLHVQPACASSSVQKPASVTAELPLFYHDIAAFAPEQHGQLSFPVQPPNFGFAARADVIPLLVNEISQASRYYPLVFTPGTSGEPFVLAAMVGVGDGVNRFVGTDSQWRANTYIPAYVRQYPFLAVNTPDGKDTILAIDKSAEWINLKGPSPFFGADGKPSERLEQTLAFAREYRSFAQRTAAMAQALQDAGVLEAGVLNLPRQGDVKARQINGFMIVSETKLNALSDEAVLKLHKSGAMGLAYAQLLSLSNLTNLVAPVAPVLGKPTSTYPAQAPATKMLSAKLDL